MSTGTRETDDPKVADRIREARTEGRRRTIFLSVVAAGLVSLFIGRAVEVNSANHQAERSRTNCHAINDVVSKGIIAPLERQADRVLGNPEKKIKPFKLEGTAFEDFAAIIRAQAMQAKLDAAAIRPLLSDCDKTFPKRSPLLFFGKVK